MEFLVEVNHNQLRTMASEMVDPIYWSHPPPSWAVPPELHVIHGLNAAYRSHDLLHLPILISLDSSINLTPVVLFSVHVYLFTVPVDNSSHCR